METRGTKEAINHGDNGFKILSEFVEENSSENNSKNKSNDDNINNKNNDSDKDNKKLIAQISLYIDRLSYSMSHTLLDCGMRIWRESL